MMMTTLLLALVVLIFVIDLSLAFLPSSLYQASRASSSLSSTESDLLTSEAIEIGRNELQHYFHFPLDDWQLQAGGEIFQKHNVIVCAPTGAGKTVVGEMALHLARRDGRKAIYTTPLKALSNQKFAELRQIFGKATVGLSTGDISINRDAQLRVMTTEVYRNMAWRSSGLEGESSAALLEDELSDTNVVVLDEFHYMGQPGRGGVWEESVITSPKHTQIVALSATLPNAAQLAAWMEAVTGRRSVLVEAKGGRPVPLRYLFATRRGLYPLFRDHDAGPGAPKGLLGLRGDGIPEMRRQKKMGFSAEDMTSSGEDRDIPRGLDINPVLKAAAQKRRMRVNNAMERLKRQEEDSDYLPGPRKNSFRSTNMSPKEERRERERLMRREMRRDVPSLNMLVRRLEQKSLLPAILFLFSRAGCDDAAAELSQQFLGVVRDPFDDEEDDVIENMDDDNNDLQKVSKPGNEGRSRGKKAQNRMRDKQGRTFRKGSDYVDDASFASMLEGEFSDFGEIEFDDSSPLNAENWKFFATAGLLEFEQVKSVAARVTSFNLENEEIAFGEEVIEQFLFGVGSHHAGQLPAHKAFVETLYRAQLMKIVFATETLAAGINMPARTTCICALAKRGDGSTMNLLETSNLLQMAGRAGRRGMDSDGTCVILATPFETEEDAANILINPIKPITSQFAPSYSLAVNLIARGQGKIDTARRLVEKSFAMWEKRKLEEKLSSATEVKGDSVSDLLLAASHERFINALIDTFKDIIERRFVGFDLEQLQLHVDLLEDRKLLKGASKGFVGALSRLDMERKTLQYLEEELIGIKESPSEERSEDYTGVIAEDKAQLEGHIERQRARVSSSEEDVARHPFTTIVSEANNIIRGSCPSGGILRADLQGISKSPEDVNLTPEDLSAFAKSIITMKKKKKNASGLDSNELIEQAKMQVKLTRDTTWLDMLALTKVLVCYGCLKSEWTIGESDDILESSLFHLTNAGQHIGRLSFENSLWSLVAMGGAHDVVGASSDLDDFRARMKVFENDITVLDDDNAILDSLFGPTKQKAPGPDSATPMAQQESMTLTSDLNQLTMYELAGYVSSLVSDGYRRGNSLSVAECFQRLTPAQQKAVQSALPVCDRLLEVQKECGTGDTNTRCDLDLSTVEVVTAWAAGCSWNEALELSGAAPGDLVRTMSRVLDALRQFGNLPISSVRRRGDTNDHGVWHVSFGLGSELREKCREAARAMNRYPVKDSLPFDTDSSEVDEDFDEEEDNQELVTNGQDDAM